VGWNPIEIFFCVVERKVLTPNDFSSMPELAEHLQATLRNYRSTFPSGGSRDRISCECYGNWAKAA
jgi:hypothetical protein